MPEPFKNFFNPKMIEQMGKHLARDSDGFDWKRFVALAVHDLDDLELKQRSSQITQALSQTLPGDFRSACEIMVRALHPVSDNELGDMSMDHEGIRGWAIMPMADYVAQLGLTDFDFSMDVLKNMTSRFSAEFAVRAFFLADPDRAMAHAHQWAQDENTHVRRLASEGSRPRLPWGTQLTMFVEDPAPLFPLLEKLKGDDEEYVRRSVANNLNDIAKDHADKIAALAGRWLKGADSDQIRMVKHACRSLIKQGHRPTLVALGYGKPQIDMGAIVLKTPVVKLGTGLDFEIELSSTGTGIQPLIIDFVIHHVKANGETSPKTFKWKVLDLKPGSSLKLSKTHPMRPVTTRVHHAGTHGLEIQINGESFGRVDFELTI